MKLEVYHRTTYRYARPFAFQPHRMILRPRGNYDIAVLVNSLSCLPVA
ncbi:transglutaminase N-terminal domain-containing protein [Mesorhizobium sp. SB112]